MLRLKSHTAAGAALLCACLCLADGGARAAPVANVLDRPALQDRQAPQRVLLGLARAGERIVAVGERGLILLSDDGGEHWRQAAVPVSVTLTAVRFATAEQGWAIGHAGVVLHTADGGATWRRQLDGRQIIRIMEASAKAAGAGSRVAAVAAQFAADGPDKPLLDLYFYDSRRGIVVGAYGLAMRTEDGGATWLPVTSALDANPDGLHLYAVAGGTETWLAGEQGFLARSRDGGRTFARVDTPYRGSWFTASPLPEGGVLVAGLKGNAWRWNGRAFERCEGFAPVSVSASASRNGTLVFADQGGHLYLAGADGAAVSALRLDRPLPPVAALAVNAGGDLLAAGLRGVVRIPAKAVAVPDGVKQ